MAAPGLRRDVPFSRFYEWAVSPDGEKLTLAEMARRSGRTSKPFFTARKAGVIDGRLVVEYARAIGRSPLEALAESLDMPELRMTPQPSLTETLSQVPYGLLLEEAAARMGGCPSRSALPAGGTSVTRWAESLGEISGMGMPALAAAVGMEYGAFSAKRLRQTFMPTELHAVCREAGGTMQVGLVAQGWLTWEEAKLPPRGREDALTEWSTDEVFTWLERAAPDLRKLAARR